MDVDVVKNNENNFCISHSNGNQSANLENHCLKTENKPTFKELSLEHIGVGQSAAFTTMPKQGPQMKNVVMDGEAVGHLIVSKIVADNKQTKLSMAWSIDMAFMYMYVTVKERIVEYTQTEGGRLSGKMI